MSGEVSFIEFGAADAMTARTFYGKLFGWSFESGPGGDGYVIDGAGVPAGVHGGDQGAAPYVFFRVDDLDAAVAASRAARRHRRGDAGRRRTRPPPRRSASSGCAATTRGRPSACIVRRGTE